MEKIKVAVIGTGLAGLTTAHLLSLQTCTKDDGTIVEFEVHVFEKAASLGMDSSSISVKTTDGSFRLDTPMRSINGGSHNRVYSLYKHLGVALREANFSYSFSRLSATWSPTETSRSPTPPPPFSVTGPLDIPTASSPKNSSSTRIPEMTPLFIYEGSNGMKWPPLSFPSTINEVLPRFLHLSHLFLVTLSYLHLLALAFFYHFLGLTRRTRASKNLRRWTDVVAIESVANEPLELFCSRHFIWPAMREELLYPLFAAVSTVGRAEVGALPTGEILEYIVDTFGAPHYVATVGVQQVVKLLSACLPISHIHLSSTITSISIIKALNSANLTRLHFDSPTQAPLDFHHVIFATQANQAEALLSSTSSPKASLSKLESERLQSLSRFAYVRTLVVNHTDTSILPPISDRRDLNLVSYPPSSVYIPSPFASDLDEKSRPLPFDTSSTTLPSSSIQATHIISRTHPHLTKSLPPSIELLQTTNPIIPIDPDCILSSTWYERAKVSVSSKKVLSRFILSPSGKSEGEIGDLQGIDGIWFCGSWCAEGLPLLEGCVSSAERAVRAIVRIEGARNVTIPF